MSDSQIYINPSLSIDAAELSFSFIRSGGPGGQNVNKVATAVQLRFDAAQSQSLPAGVRHRLLTLAGRRATKDGVIVITSHEHRSQERNRAEATERLLDLIRQASIVPKRRVATKATRSSKERRLSTKRHHSQIKSSRSKPLRSDD